MSVLQNLNQAASLISNYSCVVYVATAAAALFASWATRVKLAMTEHRYRVLTIPIAATVLILAVGTVDTFVRLGKIGVQHPVAESSTILTPAPVAPPMLKQTASPTPINSAELVALREENTKLKIDNARLRKAKAPHIVQVLPTPHAEQRRSLPPQRSAPAIATISWAHSNW
jgi:hypothetical protein